MNTDHEQHTGLWKTVENPVDNPSFEEQVSPPHAPPLQERFISLSEMTAAIDAAVTLLAARVEAIEFDLLRIIAFLDEPISHDELLRRISDLKARIGRDC